MNWISRAWQLFLRRIQGRNVSSYRGPEVILHDPAAGAPHNLDDPFHSAAVQEKIGKLIADANVTEQKPKRQ